MVHLFVVFFISLSLAGFAWEKSHSKIVAFFSGLIAASIAAISGLWVINGLSWVGLETSWQDNLYCGIGIGALNGWFVGHQLSKSDQV